MLLNLMPATFQLGREQQKIHLEHLEHSTGQQVN